jgi:adenylate kinase family enzyme
LQSYFRSKTTQRADDSKASVLKQIAEFKSQTRPIVDYLESLGKVKRVDAMKELTVVSEYCKQEVKKLLGLVSPPTVVFMMGGPGAGKGWKLTVVF